jgi:hypothetical protein
MVVELGVNLFVATVVAFWSLRINSRMGHYSLILGVRSLAIESQEGGARGVQDLSKIFSSVNATPLIECVTGSNVVFWRYTDIRKVELAGRACNYARCFNEMISKSLGNAPPGDCIHF